MKYYVISPSVLRKYWYSYSYIHLTYSTINACACGTQMQNYGVQDYNAGYQLAKTSSFVFIYYELTNRYLAANDCSVVSVAPFGSAFISVEALESVVLYSLLCSVQILLLTGAHNRSLLVL